MEKKVFLILFSILVLGCETVFDQKKSDILVVSTFYENYSDYDFSDFEYINIVQWNQNRENIRHEFHVELFYYNSSLHERPLRGDLKYVNDKPIFISSDIKTIDEELFNKFYKFNISNLFCKDIDKIGITIYPRIRLVKSCFEKKTEFISLDSCWSYKILE